MFGRLRMMRLAHSFYLFVEFGEFREDFVELLGENQTSKPQEIPL